MILIRGKDELVVQDASNLNNCKVIRNIGPTIGYSDEHFSGSVNPDKSQVAYIKNLCHPHILDLNTGVDQEIRKPSYSVCNMMWSPDGKRILVMFAHDHVSFLGQRSSGWAVLRGIIMYDPLNQRHTIESAAWFPDSKHIITGVCIQDAQMYTLIKSSIDNSSECKELGSYQGDLRKIRCSPIGDKLACLEIGSLRIVYLNDDSCEDAVLHGTISSFSWNPNNKIIAHTFRNEIRLFDTETGCYNHSIVYKHDIICIDWNDTGTEIVSANNDYTITTWDANKLKMNKVLKENYHCLWVTWKSPCNKYPIIEMFLLALESGWSA